MKLFKKLCEQGFPVQCVRMDNAGENKKLQELCESTEGHTKIKFEYTSPRTPQQNGVVEQAFATLYGRVRAMMNAAGFTSDLRGKMWAECANTATLLENGMLKSADEEPPVVKMYGVQYSWWNNLREFGIVAVITTRTNTTAKLDDRGTVAMFVGYSNVHPRDTYRSINLRTQRLMIS